MTSEAPESADWLDTSRGKYLPSALYAVADVSESLDVKKGAASLAGIVTRDRSPQALQRSTIVSPSCDRPTISVR